MQMGANGCKWVQIYTPLHINVPPNEESCPQLCATELTYIHVTKGDHALQQWVDYLFSWSKVTMH